MSQPPHPQFLVVGIGASAGGLEALQAFFTHVPADSGCAYVVILHRSPDHDSQLAAILQAVAPIPVTPVTERRRVEPDHVYVVSPDQHLTMLDGELRVSPNVEPEDRRAPVDIFFRTLADSHDGRGVCVILSGSGSDGSMGLKRVKERGGAVFVQSPGEALFAEMPRTAVATDLVDDVLPVAEIPARIVAYQANLGTVSIPEEPAQRPRLQQQALREVFALLRTRTGHDFSNYKRPTLLRRIERRINVHSLPDLPAYAAYLNDHPDEVQALLKDLLISVTNFFRDKEAFAALEQEIIPRLFAGKGPGDQIRVWVVGCATGEEAYSVAMLCAERVIDALDAPEVQVFATDIDEAAIAHARAGLYSASDVADVSPERLRRFFTREDERYRVRGGLRDMILFATHNLLSDPPFAHVDLVTCRNVLIYLNSTAQERAIETLHFALNDGGHLFLGSVESADGASDLFEPVSREQRLFLRRPAGPRPLPIPVAGQTMQPLEAEIARLKLQLRLSSEQYEYQAEELKAANEELLALNEELRLSSEELQSINEELRTVNQELKVKVEESTQTSANLQNLVNSTDIATIFLDRQLRIKLYTPAARELYNLIATDYGRPLSDLSHQLRDIDVLAEAEAVLATLQVAEHEVRAADGRVYVLRILPYRAAEDRIGGVVLTFFDITARSHAQAALHASEELQAFLLKLSDALRGLSDPVEVQATASRVLGEHLGTDRAYYVEIDEAQQEFVVARDWHRPGAPSHARRYPLDDWPMPWLVDGKTWVVRDVDVDPTLPDDQREAYRGNDIGAAVVVPLIKAGRLVATFVTNQRAPRAWTAGEVALVEETAERTWAALERARAEAAVRESEAKYRSLFTSIDDGFCIIERVAGEPPDFRYLEANPAFAAQSGVPDVVGRTIRQVVPGEAESWLAVYDRVLTAGEAVRFERELVTTGRVLELYAFPVAGASGNRLAVSFKDITERKAHEGRQAFLLRLSDVLRAEPNADAVANRALQMLSEQLRLDRCYIGVYRLADDRGDFPHQVGNDRVPPLPDGVRLSDFPEALRVALGQTLVIDDVAGTAGLSDTDRRNLSALGLSALVAATLRSGEDNPLWSIVAVSARPRRWTRGEVALVEEVTERTWAAMERARVEAALRESAGRLRALVEHLPGGAAFIVDQELRYLLAEGEALHAAGFVPEEYIGKTIFEALPPDLAASYEPLYRRALAGEAFMHEHAAHGRTYISRGTPLYSASGDVYAVLAVSYDISDRKRAEAALRASETRFRTLADTVPQLIWTNDAEGRAIYFNQRWYAYSGLSEEQSTGPGWQAIIHPHDEASSVERWQQAVSRGDVFESEYRLRGADGSYRWHLGRSVPLRDERGQITGWFGSATDIEALKQAEAARQESVLLRRLAAAQEEERLRIARDLHDQLGQLITGLLLQLKQLEGPARGTAVAPLLPPVQALAIDMAKEAHRIAVNLRPTALEDVGLIPALERLVADWSAQSGVPAAFQSQGLGQRRLPQPVEVALFRVAQEALTNVHKHAEATQVSVVLQQRGGQVTLVVEDNGWGFVEAESLLAEGRPQLGVLGMRERVGQLGGTFEIESSPGSGTTILVRVPLAPQAPTREDLAP